MRLYLKLALITALIGVKLASAQPTAQSAPSPPTNAEYQAAIRQLAVGAADDAGRTAQLRMALGQVEAQRDAALARARDAEAKVVPGPVAPSAPDQPSP